VGGREKKLVLFSRHLSGFLRSRVPILRAIEILERQEREASFKRILRSIRKDLKEGRPLSGAMERYPKRFPPMYTAMVRAGEHGSALEKTLCVLGDYLKRHERAQSLIRQALVYPAILLLAGAATVMFIVSVVVPRLTLLFEGMGKDLPWSTEIVISIGRFMRYGWPIVLAVLVFCFVLVPMALSRRLGPAAWDSFKMKLPMFGPLLFRADVSRFCRSLKVSLANGISFLQALDVAIPTLMLGNLRERMRGARASVEKGARFGSSLARCREFPPFVTDMISVGEESGNLEEVLEEIAGVYEEEAEDRLKFITTVLEPALILCVGLIVGFIAVSMLLPIFEMDVMS